MELYWMGKNITRFVNITGCEHRDFSGGKCDCLELTLDNASDWYRWGPREDDEVRVTDGLFDTGTLYLTAVLPAEGRYRLLATGVKQAARRKAWASYANINIEKLMQRVSAECGMEARLFGVNGALTYGYVLRENEGCAAFLSRVGQWDGFTVKAFNGALRAVSIAYAQNMPPEANIRIESGQQGVIYRRFDNDRWAGVTVKTPFAEATARDSAVTLGSVNVFTDLPAADNAQAGRWARGLLLAHNRQCEELITEQELNTGLRALARVDVYGGTDADGKWICDMAEHNIIEKRTRARFLRVTDTIG